MLFDVLRQMRALGRGLPATSFSRRSVISFDGMERRMASIAASALERFFADKIEQKFQRGVLTGERDGRQQDRAPPRIVCCSRKRFPQNVEALRRMRSGNRQGGFGGVVVGGNQETANPRDCARAFNAQDSAVTGAQHFRFVGADGWLAEREQQ